MEIPSELDFESELLQRIESDPQAANEICKMMRAEGRRQFFTDEELIEKFKISLKEGAVSEKILETLNVEAEIEVSESQAFKNCKIYKKNGVIFLIKGETLDYAFISLLENYYCLHHESGQYYLYEIIETEDGFDFILKCKENGMKIRRTVYNLRHLPQKVIDNAFFDPEFWEQQVKKNDVSFRLMAEVLAKNLNLEQAANVLDIGSGTGLLEELFTNTKLKFTALDGKAEMLEFSKKKNLPNIEAYHQITLGQGAKIDLPDESFDHIVSNGVFYYIHSLKFTLMEAHRLLKPGGRLHFSIDEGENDLLEVRDGVIQDNEHMGLSLSFGEFIFANDVIPALAQVGDGRLKKQLAQNFKFYQFSFKREDVLQILDILGFEITEINKRHVHRDANTGEMVDFTYFSARKR